ncbi:DUF947-domain-containing protein [Westerdykella ornata]|uniref:rRNA biogenesis protein RRP36 n=1 Tax=Westerdykella ornata TaxID=318751 RepID=A0A6A6JVZ1_WESOR|nr:DUF947-domain-containing protein [Westerdykella ornata]KAF2280384.1 DUF947-domain-containing protein [Westerdykella ornata]
MPLSSKLERRIQAGEDYSDDEEYYEVTDRSSPSIIDTGEGADILSSDSEDEEGLKGNDEEESDSHDRIQRQISKVSFGALAKAQDALARRESGSRKRKRGEDALAAQEDKLQALRERLRTLKAEKLVKSAGSDKPSKSSAKSNKRHKENEAEDGDDGDDSSDSDGAPRARSSKHAPAVQSSKRAVTRRRTVVEVKKPTFRDPRFDNAVAGTKPDDNTLKHRYGFLEDYKESEMAELRAAIKKTKNEDDKEKLKRKLLSMESQKKAREAKEKQQQILSEHKKRERELIKQGKQPFYLKKSEQKKLALIDRFQNMKAKQRDKVIERRRKKVASKERKNMPAARRTTERF